MKKIPVNFSVNGESHELMVEPNALLLNVLRDELGLTGTKYSCGTGQCGTCTVWVNGESILSCLTLAVSVEGADIMTIEGLAKPTESLDPVQDAFIEHGAIQCGFCTPAMVLMARELLNKNPHASESEMREHLKGTLCRCTGYTRIIKAIKSCAESE